MMSAACPGSIVSNRETDGITAQQAQPHKRELYIHIQRQDYQSCCQPATQHAPCPHSALLRQYLITDTDTINNKKITCHNACLPDSMQLVHTQHCTLRAQVLLIAQS